jgi:hypothetical protein
MSMMNSLMVGMLLKAMTPQKKPAPHTLKMSKPEDDGLPPVMKEAPAGNQLPKEAA